MPAEQPIHYLYGKKRLLAPKICPAHVTKSEPPRLKPALDALLTNLPDPKIEEYTHPSACRDSRQGAPPKFHCRLVGRAVPTKQGSRNFRGEALVERNRTVWRHCLITGK